MLPPPPLVSIVFVSYYTTLHPIVLPFPQNVVQGLENETAYFCLPGGRRDPTVVEAGRVGMTKRGAVDTCSLVCWVQSNVCPPTSNASCLASPRPPFPLLPASTPPKTQTHLHTHILPLLMPGPGGEKLR